MERMRDVTGDPAAMLALAHPTRLAVLELLAEHGPLTATEAGRLLDESPGTMSWHLRMLARHGFVTEAESSGRRRPWRLTALGTRWDPEPRTATEQTAAETLSRAAVEHAIGQLSAWLASRYTASSDWQRAAALSDWTLYLSAAETEQLRNEVYRLFERYTDRLADRRRRPRDAVPVRAFFAMHPQRPPAADGD
jgi:DNA-binding transcriptional ArsR family regulator